MQKDHVLKKMNFDLPTPSPGSEFFFFFFFFGGGGGVCGQRICYHVAAFVILFNLISNVAMFLKS